MSTASSFPLFKYQKRHMRTRSRAPILDNERKPEVGGSRSFELEGAWVLMAWSCLVGQNCLRWHGRAVHCQLGHLADATVLVLLPSRAVTVTLTT